MDNPIEELACVVLSVTEPSSAEVFRNIDKYFTEDVALFYPIFNQIYNRNGRENLKAAYQWRKTFTFNSKIKFNAIMVSKDQTQATLDITSTFRLRLLPIKAFDPQINFIIRVGLRKCPCDGKYRIYRQQDNFPSDLTQSGVPLPQFVRIISDVTKAIAWLLIVYIGHILMMLGIF
ncbi:hypothetical protein Pst134EA_025790 [Puccinia striiformis f. sp. tritici]|uniref:SigF-like NTF2-like domain-containing protein n=1 Tax=Puccinia striiformis f. sp. tritici PST-78 TaxID=1165861 RepID=A0A0L0VWR7_9BASI|nr:uncharacterized protein Pst134EA_031979 [Puccinia striiformis f. sp. tritici]XP_047800127.1 hypothetical protein Pst134EA_025774 [Puccinia striiformis f. sp. tritici]XP_047800142.1 hypothetical protein Pst134EA_025790 [Puccinia striiformis f. sp. tritici]KAI9615064.1 hypothetical protein H4Q26_011602 [Puccinia striiformis f. sp. tritici PST-130]KNF03702.1 hypothetical protein PSTG_03223 [Puccinia striiformis f. sp. tritici PST-78]KAH9443994.1 hypothetical protein Pst134EB_026380 [Puccinia s